MLVAGDAPGSSGEVLRSELSGGEVEAPQQRKWWLSQLFAHKPSSRTSGPLWH